MLSPMRRASTATALARTRQMAARCVLPEPAGPASTTTGEGQSGQRSTSAAAWLLVPETTSSSRE
ncbi:hypothetical protein ACVINZ_006154 [Mesorhizobium jarvisii]